MVAAPIVAQTVAPTVATAVATAAVIPVAVSTAVASTAAVLVAVKQWPRQQRRRHSAAPAAAVPVATSSRQPCVVNQLGAGTDRLTPPSGATTRSAELRRVRRGVSAGAVRRSKTRQHAPRPCSGTPQPCYRGTRRGRRRDPGTRRGRNSAVIPSLWVRHGAAVWCARRWESESGGPSQLGELTYITGRGHGETLSRGSELMWRKRLTRICDGLICTSLCFLKLCLLM